MEMDMRAMTPEERKYAYSQSTQINAMTGCIGHLRADMGSTGDEFYSSWEDHRSDLKTPAFQEEFNEAVNTLRKDLLKSRSRLDRYCTAHPEADFGNGREWGIRADTGQYSYLMRLNPFRGEYNLYCYCYTRDWLDRHMNRARAGIRFITPEYREKFRIPDGDLVRIITGNEVRDRVARYIDGYHVEVGNGRLFHICEFAENLERTGSRVIPLRSSLPEMCYMYLPVEHGIGIVRKGESGYFASDLQVPATVEAAKALVEEANAEKKVSRQQAAAMSAGSMFGWETRAADPASYNEMGIPLRNIGRERGDSR